MNLDEFGEFDSLDIENMISHIEGLPDQLQKAWDLGLKLELPKMLPVSRVVVAGMGGSAIGADLLASFLADRMTVPMSIQRDYGLPAFAFGKETLVIVSSHSGNTEESLTAFEEACRSGCQVLVVTTGGRILADAQAAGVPAWIFVHKGQPRAAVGFSFGLLLALFVRLGLVSDLAEEVKETVKLMHELGRELAVEVPVRSNSAKRMAGQLVGRHATIFGSGFMMPVARRWKCQINEVAKAVASFEFLPEADHNTLAGICNPENALDHEIAVFLQASKDYVRNQRRVLETRQVMLQEGLNTDIIEARGSSKLAQMWTTILFGDYISYYLAMLYDIDPTAIEPIWALKDAMSK